MVSGNVSRHVISVLFGAIFTLAASWSAGKLLLAPLRLNLYRGERQFFRFVTGAACFSLLIFLLTAAGLARTWVFLTAGLALIAAARFLSAPEPEPAPLPDIPYRWKLVFYAIFAAFAVFYFVNALAPETSPDGSTYHLGLVARYLRQHGFGRITTNMYANLSEALEMLFLVAFSFGRHSAAALVELAFFLSLPLAMVNWARRRGIAVAGITGAVMVLASPVFGISGSSAYNDAAGACVIFALFYLLDIWIQARNPKLIPLAGLLAGFAFGLKFTLFLATPYAAAVIAWNLWRARKPVWKPLALFAACAAVMILPWLAKNYVIVGNPFSPFLNSIFPNHYISIRFEKEYSALMRDPSFNGRERLFDNVVGGGRTGGLLGAAFLLAPLGLFALRYSEGASLAIAAAVFALPAFTNTQTRFLMPCAVFVALVIGRALSGASGATWLVVAFAAFSGWPSVVSKYCGQYAWMLHDFPAAAAFRKIPEPEFLDQHMPGIHIAEMINKAVPPNGKVLSFADPPQAYISREVLVGYQSAAGNLYSEILQTALFEGRDPSWILRLAFSPRALLGIRVVQAASNKSDLWSVAELRLFDKGKEIPRAPEWKLSAKPNPWDVQLAFDNNPSTRWSSLQPLARRMRLQIEWNGWREVDRVELECSHDQWSSKLRVEGEVRPGEWTTIADKTEAFDRPSNWDLRRAAIVALENRGITHILVNSGDFCWKDFGQRKRQWGIELAGEAAGSRLYRLR